MTKIIVGLGYDAPKYKIPYGVLYVIALVIQIFCFLLKPFKELQPTLTPMKVALAGTHHFYCCERAKAELGYKPAVSVDDGIHLTLEHFAYLKRGDKKK